MRETPMRKEEMQRRPRREKYLMAGMYRSDPKSRIAPEMSITIASPKIHIKCVECVKMVQPDESALQIASVKTRP